MPKRSPHHGADTSANVTDTGGVRAEGAHAEASMWQAPAASEATSQTEAFDEMEELRRLLLKPEQERLERLTSYEEQVEMVSSVLPEAVIQRMSTDQTLSKAFSPTIEEALRTSIQTDPQPLADALFPIIGPAIRKSIAEAMRSMMETFNKAIENSLSVQSLQWRFEARRTGQTYAQVVLRRTLLFRVEQLFVIERETGMPLVHVAAEAVDTQDGALVSGMLTAIQAFVQDSFGMADSEVLDAMQMGDLTVWVEVGPDAFAAAVIRGVPDPVVRETLKELIETFHLQYGPQLGRFDGNSAPFEKAEPLVEQGLISRFHVPPKKKNPMAQVVLGGVGVLLLVWLVFAVRAWGQWNDYVARLSAAPGIVVIDAGKVDGRWQVSGLRDPLAPDPDSLLQQTPLDPEEVLGLWEPYLALDEGILLRRIRQQLEAPASITLAIEGGRLIATGTALPEWIRLARTRAPFLAGALPYDDSALVDANLQEVARRSEALKAHVVRFATGASRLAEGQDEALQEVAVEVLQLQELAARSGQALQLQVLGYASNDGTATVNQRVSLARAEVVRRALIDRGVPAASVVAVGTGQPRAVAQNEADRALNRSVSFRVVVE